MHDAAAGYSLPDDRDTVEGTARVVGVEGGLVWLEPEQTTSCGGCASAGMCGTKTGGTGWLAARRFSMADEHGLAVGERVVVGISPGTLVGASATAYGLPLVTALGAGLAGQHLFGGDAASALSALAGLAAGLGLVRLRAQRLTASGRLAPRFLRRAPRPADGGDCNA